MTKRDPKTRFLLVQEDKIVDTASEPNKLFYSIIDGTTVFDVAIGCINEFGKPEVIRVIASAFPIGDATCLRITSLVDGPNRMVGFTTSMTQLIRMRLNTYFARGLFDDLLQLPATIIIRGAK